MALPRNMPVSSNYPTVDIPDLDLWSFLFERKDRPFPDDKSEFIQVYSLWLGGRALGYKIDPHANVSQFSTRMPTPSVTTRISP